MKSVELKNRDERSKSGVDQQRSPLTRGALLTTFSIMCLVGVLDPQLAEASLPRLICAEAGQVVELLDARGQSVGRLTPLQEIKLFQGWGRNEITVRIQNRPERLVRVQTIDAGRGVQEGYVKINLVKTRNRCTHSSVAGQVATVPGVPASVSTAVAATPAPTSAQTEVSPGLFSGDEFGIGVNPIAQPIVASARPTSPAPAVIAPTQQIVVPEDDEEDEEEETDSPSPAEETQRRPLEMSASQVQTAGDRPAVRPTAPRSGTQDLGRDIRGLQDGKCCVFPIRIRPQASYTQGKTKFAARRSGGRRLHAGVDLYTPQAQPFRSVADGRILQSPYRFYQGTYALEVLHQGGFVVRYGEIFPQLTRGLGTGSRVTGGQDLGRIKKTRCCHPMLHFELYSGQARGALSQRSGNRFQRRRDITDPTSHMLRWEQKSFRTRD